MDLSKRKKFLVVICGVSVVVVLGVVYFWWHKDIIVSYEFAGRISKIEGSTIFMKGSFLDTSGLSIDPKNKKDVEVLVSAQTEFVKTSIRLPTAEQLKETNGYFNPAELPKEIVAGSLEEVKNLAESSEGYGIKATSDSNIYKKSKFKADKVDYIVPLFQ